MSIDGQGVLVGMGVGVGTVALGSGMANAANRHYRAKFGELKTALELASPMSAEQWLGRIEQFDHRVGKPMTYLKNTGAVLALGGAIVGTAMIGAALLGGD